MRGQAFAKSVGSYRHLEMGAASEALEDLTGCPAVRFSFADPAVKKAVDSGALFDTLLEADRVRARALRRFTLCKAGGWVSTCGRCA